MTVMWGPMDSGWWGFGMMLSSLLFLALIVVGIVFIVRFFSDGGRTARRPDGNRALDILDERFARGEVEQEEYEERRNPRPRAMTHEPPRLRVAGFDWLRLGLRSKACRPVLEPKRGVLLAEQPGSQPAPPRRWQYRRST